MIYYHKILSGSKIDKVIEVELLELCILAILAVISYFVITSCSDQSPIINQIRLLLVIKAVWFWIDTLLLSKHNIHWYRFI